MPTHLGACEGFVWNLRRSNLVDRGRLEQIVRDFVRQQPETTPSALADYLVRQGILNRFQIDRLVQGKIQDLVIGPYVVLGTLGFGSMGTVYKVQSKNDGRWYALKQVPRRNMWNVRIARRIVRLFEKIRHPAVVGFVDVNISGPNLYFVWPFIEGETLVSLVQQKGRLFPGLVGFCALQIAEGLSACHQQGIVHGMLKPSDIMVGPDQQVYMLDMGIGSLLSETEGAKLLDTMSTATTVTAGLDCRSPENIIDSKNRTPAGDQYSMGCVLYYCLTGRFPFPEETAVEKMIAHQAKEPVPIRSLRPEVPQPLAAVVARLMQKTPESRYFSLDEAIECLKPFAVSPAVAARLAAMEIGGGGSRSGDRESKMEDRESNSGAVSFVPESSVHDSHSSRSSQPFDFQSSVKEDSTSNKHARTFGEGRKRLAALFWLAAGVVLLGFLIWLLFYR